MANECTFCGVRHIETNHLVLNEGQMWVEFCDECSGKEVLTNDKGEHWLVRELWASCRAKEVGVPFMRQPADVELAQRLFDEAELTAELSRDDSEYEYWQEWEAYQQQLHEEYVAMMVDAEQLAVDHWDNVVERCWLRGETPPNYVMHS